MLPPLRSPLHPSTTHPLVLLPLSFCPTNPLISSDYLPCFYPPVLIPPTSLHHLPLLAACPPQFACSQRRLSFSHLLVTYRFHPSLPNRPPHLPTPLPVRVPCPPSVVTFPPFYISSLWSTNTLTAKPAALPLPSLLHFRSPFVSQVRLFLLLLHPLPPHASLPHPSVPLLDIPLVPYVPYTSPLFATFLSRVRGLFS